jgi:hypothetical protein
LRQSFLDGSLTRLVDPDAVLRGKIVEFVGSGTFGLASGAKADGTYDRVWFNETISPDEVMFDANVFLLTKPKAKALKERAEPEIQPSLRPEVKPPVEPPTEPGPGEEGVRVSKTIRITGDIPPEIWNRLSTKLLPKLKSGKELNVNVGFSVTVDAATASHLQFEVRQILQDLGLSNSVSITFEP